MVANPCSSLTGKFLRVDSNLSKELMMPRKKTNPTTFIAIGICYMGAGVALAAALRENGASAVGIALIGVGVVFLVMGATQIRKGRSGKKEDEE
jgi:hypothetical protein